MNSQNWLLEGDTITVRIPMTWKPEGGRASGSPRHFGKLGRHAIFCLQPFARIRNEIDDADRAVEDLGGQLGHIVKGWFRRRSNNPIGIYRLHPLTLVFRNRKIHRNPF